MEHTTAPHGRITQEPDGAWTAIPAHGPATYEYATRGHALAALINTPQDTNYFHGYQMPNTLQGDTLEYIGPSGDPDEFTTCPTCSDTRCNGAYYADPNCGAHE